MMKTAICFLFLVSISSSAMASVFFECHKKTGKTSHEEKISATLVPIADTIQWGAILTSPPEAEEGVYFDYVDTRVNPRTGISWSHMTQMNPHQEGQSTKLTLEAKGHSRRMFVETMTNEGVLVSSESYLCFEESTI